MNIDLQGLGEDRARWDKRQRELNASFLQSSWWAEFQGSLGRQAHFLEGSGWTCLLLSRRAPVGRYLFAPYGPTVRDTAAAENCFSTLKEYAKDKGYDWLRLEPVGASAETLRSALKVSGGRKAPHEVEPHLTRVVDLSPGMEDILAGISQTTRNIIRRNQREQGLTFKTSRDPADIPLFTRMLSTVAKRKGVGFYDDDYYRKQARALMPAGMLELEIAYDGRTPIGTALIHDFGGRSSYTYAASLPEARDKNVSALLLWQAMLNAKERGNKEIDLYGIAPDSAGPEHPWYGFSAFKKKFGGQVVEYAGTWDLPVSGKYPLYRAAQHANKLLKRR